MGRDPVMRCDGIVELCVWYCRVVRLIIMSAGLSAQVLNTKH